jgi:4a-hydroxytetrahydrobiopterin dehydratase
MRSLKNSEIEKLLIDFPDWDYQDNALTKEFKFDNFKECLSVVFRIAFECEKLNHHPYWSNTFNLLKIKLSTHDAGGITELDFKLAESIEKIIEVEQK